MSKSQRDKGQRREREAYTHLCDELGHQHIERNYGQSANGGIDIKAGPFGVEVKARNTIACVRWLDQAIAASAPLGLVPVVYAREDRGEPIVIMRAADAMKLMMGEM